MEKEQNFEIDLTIRSGIPEVDAYIDKIHEHLLKFDTSSIKAMLLALDDVSKVITEDLVLIAKGETQEAARDEIDEDIGEGIWVEGASKLKVLSDDKNSKVFDRFMVLVAKVEDFEKLSKMADTIKPVVVDKSAPVKKGNVLEIETGKGLFQQMQENALDKQRKK